MQQGLSNLRILVVEDESMVSMLIQDLLGEIGCAVAGTAAEVGTALERVASLDFDAAVLDVNLDGTKSYAVADALRARGIPFVMATGYGIGGLPDAYRSAPVLTKPFRQEDLEQALRTVLM